MNQLNILKRATTVFILLCLIAPCVILILNTEKPTLELDLDQPKITAIKSKNYFSKNYGLKESLLEYYLNFKINTLKESALPNQVVKGKNDWLFLGNKHHKSFNNAFGNDDFTKKKASQINNNLKKISTYLDSEKIPFYFVIAPDKNQIYSEQLPFQLKKNNTRTNKLIKKIKSETNINCFSLHKVLIENKHKSELYIKTDSHWNSYGAFIGYQEIMKKINTQNLFKTEKIEDYNIIETLNFSGDLSNMLLSSKKASNIIFERKKPNNIEVISYTSYSQHYKNKNGSGKLMIYRDSFTNALTPFFNNTFNEVIYIRGHNLNRKLINSFKPDVIILEKIERNLIHLSEMKSPLE